MRRYLTAYTALRDWRRKWMDEYFTSQSGSWCALLLLQREDVKKTRRATSSSSPTSTFRWRTVRCRDCVELGRYTAFTRTAASSDYRSRPTTSTTVSDSQDDTSFDCINTVSFTIYRCRVKLPSLSTTNIGKITKLVSESLLRLKYVNYYKPSNERKQLIKLKIFLQPISYDFSVASN